MVRYVVAIAVACASAALPQVQSTVPSSLLSSVGSSPIEFTVLLAEASVPSGLEIKEPGDSRSRPVPYADADSGRRIPATQLAARFNAVHSDYHALVMDGVFVIRPVGDNAAFLDERSAIDPPISITGRMQAARRIFGMHGAILGSTFSLEGEDKPIVLDGTGGRKVIDTLNEIVMQSPSAWQVTTRKQGNQWRVVAFGFIRKDGSSSIQPLRAQDSGR